MSVPRRVLTVLSAALAVVVLSSSPAVADAGPPPSSMASLGDSITRAFNACGWYMDCPSRSFSTGSTTYVNSHYLRIRAVNYNINGRNYNDAASGAKSNAMYSQAGTAVSQGVQYVTMLIGANDACTSTEAGMTPVSTFRANIDAGLNRLKAGLPNARVFVISVPNIYRLWYIGYNDQWAREAWYQFGICQSMLANPTSFAQADIDRRYRVRQRVVDYNTQLAQACAAYGTYCKFDNNTLFNYPFALSHMSTWDYFHPNEYGQQILARETYAVGFGW